MRGTVRARKIARKLVELNEAEVNTELVVRHKEAPTKVEVFAIKGNEGKRNIPAFFKEGKELKGHVALYGSGNGFIKLGEKGRPRLCRTRKTFYLGLYRKQPRCGNCNLADHRESEYKDGCASCSCKHRSDSMACPLWPRKTGGGWTYSNAWIVANVRRQMEDKAIRAQQAKENKASTD